MQIHDSSSRAIRFGIILVVLGLMLTSSNCTASGKNRYDYEVAVSAARDAGLTPYWLGEDFSAGGLEFKTLEGSYPTRVLGADVPALELRYSAQTDISDDTYLTVARVGVQTLSRTDFAGAEDMIRTAQGNAGVTSRQVEVAGVTADLIAVPLSTRAVNQLILIAEFEDVFVVARTNSSHGDGGEEVNPLIRDESLFLSVMDRLRPYPD